MDEMTRKAEETLALQHDPSADAVSFWRARAVFFAEQILRGSLDAPSAVEEVEKMAWFPGKEVALDLARRLDAWPKEFDKREEQLEAKLDEYWEAKQSAEAALREAQKEIEHWKKMYECAQNANAYRADALDKL